LSNFRLFISFKDSFLNVSTIARFLMNSFNHLSLFFLLHWLLSSIWLVFVYVN
jgi:hypothetical protein